MLWFCIKVCRVAGAQTCSSRGESWPPALIDSPEIDVSFSCVCPVIHHEFRHNIVIVGVDPQGDSQVDQQTTLTML